MALAVGPALPCPKCRRALESASWRDDRHARCRYCETETEFRPFPALHATYSVVKAQAVVLGEEATCFFHATNQAAAVCADCGRLLCHVCSVPHDNTTLCPACIANRRKQQAQAVNSRFLWGGAALSLTVVPLVLGGLGAVGFAFQRQPGMEFFLIMGSMVFGVATVFSTVAGPAAICLALIGWKRPGSILGPQRWKHLVGLGLGALIVLGWILVIIGAANHW